MTCRSSIERFLIVGLLLSCRNQTMAYPPYECRAESAKDDFKVSSLIVIGKVTAIEKYRTSEPDSKRRFFLATISVGRVLKGDVKPGQEILFFMGFSRIKEEDNLHSSDLVVANTHSGWHLDVDNAYLLCLRPSTWLEDKAHAELHRDGAWHDAGLNNCDVWEPRSCHYSVHRITRGRDPARVIVQPKHGWEGSEEWVPLDEFIAEQTKGRFPLPHESNEKSPEGKRQ